jgi:chemotaxis protein histidine kinase CheA
VSGHSPGTDLAVTLARLRGEEVLKAADATEDFGDAYETSREQLEVHAGPEPGEMPPGLEQPEATSAADAMPEAEVAVADAMPAADMVKAEEPPPPITRAEREADSYPSQLAPAAPAPPAVAPRDTAVEVASGQAEANWKIETIRVDPTRLDALLAMAGELIVATTRARRGRSEFETLEASIEESARAAAGARRALHELERALERTRDRGKSRWERRDSRGNRLVLDR